MWRSPNKILKRRTARLQPHLSRLKDVRVFVAASGWHGVVRLFPQCSLAHRRRVLWCGGATHHRRSGPLPYRSFPARPVFRPHPGSSLAQERSAPIALSVGVNTSGCCVICMLHPTKLPSALLGDAHPGRGVYVKHVGNDEQRHNEMNQQPYLLTLRISSRHPAASNTYLRARRNSSCRSIADSCIRINLGAVVRQDSQSSRASYSISA